MINNFTKGTPKDKWPSEIDIRDAFNNIDKDGVGSLKLKGVILLVKNILQDMVNNMWWIVMMK